MKSIYTAVMARLKEEVPAIKWIDLDTGQLNESSERPPVAFPCVLIGISVSNCQDIYGKIQQCRATVTVRIAQNPAASRTNSQVREEIRENALQFYALIDNVYAALQGFETGEFCPLSRTKQQKENRRDGLFVFAIEFQTEFEDLTAEV